MKTLFRKLKSWLTKDNKLSVRSYSFKEILPLLSITVLFCGFIYWHVFFGHFNIKPSIYLNLEDAMLINYNKAVLFLISILFFSPLLGFALLTVDKKDQKNGEVLFTNFWIALMVAGALFGTLHFQNPESLFLNVLISTICAALCFSIKLLKKAMVFGIFGILSVLLSVHLGNLDAKKVWRDRITFDLVLKNKEKILESGSKSSFLVASTTDYIFIYDDSSRKIRPILKNEIELIEFPLHN